MAEDRRDHATPPFSGLPVLMSDWDRIFDELYLRTYAPLQQPEDAETQAEAVARLLGLVTAADVLDCPCGYGRHAIPLGRAGFHVVGADRSPVLLAEAERRAGDVDWPRFVEADYRELPFEDASFDCVTNLFSSLGYWGEEGDLEALREFRRVLRADGSLVVETMHRDRLIAVFQRASWEELPDGALMIEKRVFDPIEGVVHVEHGVVEPDGRRVSVPYEIRAYTATELSRLVRQAGFEEVSCYGDLDGGPLSSETRLVVVAR